MKGRQKVKGRTSEQRLDELYFRDGVARSGMIDELGLNVEGVPGVGLDVVAGDDGAARQLLPALLIVVDLTALRLEMHLPAV